MPIKSLFFTASILLKDIYLHDIIDKGILSSQATDQVLKPFTYDCWPLYHYFFLLFYYSCIMHNNIIKINYTNRLQKKLRFIRKISDKKQHLTLAWSVSQTYKKPP